MTDPVTSTPAVEPAVNVEPAVVATNTEPTILTPQEPAKPDSWYTDAWREKLAGGDAKELARLARFTDPSQVYKSYRELETAVSSGKLKQEVDTSKFDEAQLAEWRTANGIPAKPEDYNLKVPDGLVLSDADEVILGSVLETMHQQNRKTAEVQAVVDKFLGARELAVSAEVEKQKVEMVKAEETLRQEWQGQAYLTNLAAVKNLLAAAPEGIGEMITTARLSDGSLVGSNPAALKWLANLALELNPAGTIVPGTGANQMQSVEAELSELNQLMKTDLNAWRKNDAARTRHRELIDAQLKLKSRGY